jgi:putative ABC transport system permease protein
MQILQDVRYALRQFANAKGFTATAVLTLALGIGATTAIFSLVHAVLLKSLPVAKPEELYRIGVANDCCVNGGLQDDWTLFSYDMYQKFKDQTPGFLELAAFQTGRSQIGVRRIGANQPAESYLSEFISGNYFSMFGLGAYAGRLINNEDDRKGADPVAVMSYATWQQKFGRDPSVVGASFAFNGQPFTVVGIAPPGFFGERLGDTAPAVWMPLNQEPLVRTTNSILERADLDWLDMIGRITPGANPKAMEAQLQVELRQWLESPLSKLDAGSRTMIPKQTLHLSPGGAGVQMMRDEYEEGLHLLFWISGLVLLISCANVANLMLVRATMRKQHTAIRAALGASRAWLMRQILTESVVLSLLGGIAGVAVAYGGARLILYLAFQKQYVPISAAPSWPVLGFAFAASLATGILFGVAPAWIISRTDPAEALRGASRSTRRHGAWTQRSLVVVQAAMSLMLLCAAGLLTRSLKNLQNQDFGFETEGRYIGRINPQMAGYKPEQLDAFYRRVRESLMQIPGVTQSAFAIYSPMGGDNWGETVFIQGQAPPPPDSDVNNASWVRASDGYFESLGTRIVQGRSFTEQDTRTSRAVALVNETFVKKFFKDQNPIGQHFGDLEPRYAGNFEIVGVTEDTYYRRPPRPVRPMFFLPAAQWTAYDDPRWAQFENGSHFMGTIILQTRGSVPALEEQVRRALSGINPDLPLIDFTSFGEQVASNFSQKEMIVKLTSLFGLLALILACVGLYGVTAYSVERRTSEIGIRMALGADRFNVLKLVLRGAFLQVAVGLIIGIPGTIAAGRAMAAQLFNVKPYDPQTLLSTTFVLALAAFLATLVPARRAAAVEPMHALRTE